LGTVCRLAPGPGGDRRIGLVWNLSASGLSMLLNEALEPGAAIIAEIMTESGGSKLPVTVRVAHVTKLRTGDYFLGAQFDRPLTGEEMRPFLGKAPAV
jgi:hypothetical protein